MLELNSLDKIDDVVNFCIIFYDANKKRVPTTPTQY